MQGDNAPERTTLPRPEGADAPGKGECVYVIGTPGSNTVKIGRSTDLPKRIADIQRMSPVPLEVLWSHPGGSELETRLHRHFKERRSHGEWFTFDSDPLPLIGSAVEEQPWLRPKVNLKKAKRKTRGREPIIASCVDSPEELARKAAKLDESRLRLLRYVESADDPVEQFRRADQVQALIAEVKRDVFQGVALELKAQGRTWREVGKTLGVTAQRAHQLSLGAAYRGKTAKSGE